MHFRTHILGATALACALAPPRSAGATSKVRVEWVLMTPPVFNQGAADNAPSLIYGAQLLTIAAPTVSSSGVAPTFASAYGGFARLYGVVGAVYCTADGSTPSETNGVRVAAGDKLPVAVKAGQTVSCAEAADQPSPASSAQSSVAWSASGVSAVSTAISAAGASASFAPLAGRTFHVQLTGTASASCYLERQLDGTNWVPLTSTAGGATTILYNWTYSGASLSEDVIESQTGALYRVDCGQALGNYTSGTLNVRISQ